MHTPIHSTNSIHSTTPHNTPHSIAEYFLSRDTSQGIITYTRLFHFDTPHHTSPHVNTLDTSQGNTHHFSPLSPYTLHLLTQVEYLTPYHPTPYHPSHHYNTFLTPLSHHFSHPLHPPHTLITLHSKPSKPSPLSGGIYGRTKLWRNPRAKRSSRIRSRE